VAFLIESEEMMDARVEGIPAKSVTMLLAGGMGFCASTT
jgi:hypothetical protein